MVRAASGLFQLSRVMHALHAPPAGGGVGSEASIAMATKLNVLWQAVGVTQHHDGVTGTSPPNTYVDYRARLNYGSDLAAGVVSELLGGEHTLCIERPVCANTNNTHLLGPHMQPHCVEGGAPLCGGSAVLGGTSAVSMVVMNPLAWVSTGNHRLVVSVQIPPASLFFSCVLFLFGLVWPCSRTLSWVHAPLCDSVV